MVRSTTVVEFRDVSKTYPTGWLGRQQIPAVHDVSFSLAPGEVFGLLGPNRAGKTTLIKLLLSLCRPTGGQVIRLGRPSTDRTTLARIGYMHENQAFPRYWNAAGLLEFYGALAFVPESHLHERVARLLELVDLTDRSREPIARFSKGMVQRLALAQSLINDPELLVLDEPTEGLDLAGRRLLFDVIQDQRRRGRTVLLVSHVVNEVERHCDRVAVLHQSRLIYTGSVNNLTGNRPGSAAASLEDALQALYERHAA